LFCPTVCVIILEDMFLDKEKKIAYRDQKAVFGQKSEIKDPNHSIFVLFGVIAIFILSAALLFILFKKPKTTARFEPSGMSATSSVGRLPDYSSGQEGIIQGGSGIDDNLTAENASFGHFYKKPETSAVSLPYTYSLPINIKTDTANYYDASRKINLDDYLSDLNNSGFAILNKQNEVVKSDFYAAYRDLSAKDLPIAITSDFVLYNYQNTLKDAYKDIRKNVFYEHVWNLNKSFYEIALTRYKKTAAETQSANNPVLEGQRMQLAYFAMALKLLMPSGKQIIMDASFSDPNKFTAQEADAYGFVIPEFIRDDIERESSLIGYANRIEKSPIMLYPVNYEKFSVPEHYRQNAKLNNFYLCLEWLKSVFPLYFQSADCEDCLLDKDDWGLNLYAAARTARDFSENQELKNRWAVIYKFISFFSGLRQDLTYLNYHAALQELFGQDYDLEKIFSSGNPGREQDLKSIQGRIAEFRFSAIEGGIDRTDLSLRPNLGMRLLQEDYWPNDYIFKKLSGKNILAQGGKNAQDAKKTACPSKQEGGIYRCGGFGYDVVNLLEPINGAGQYIGANTAYDGYEEGISSLRQEIGSFNQNTWNNNIYWFTLDILRPVLAEKNSALPYAQDGRWRREKVFQTALGAWVNLHLADDVLVIYSDEGSAKPTAGLYAKGCNTGNYLEPDSGLFKDLMARNAMFLKMIDYLDIDKDTNAASLEIRDFDAKLSQLLSVSEKISSRQILDDDDCHMLDDFARRFSVEKKAEKSFVITITEKKTLQSIDGVKIAAMVYSKEKEKILVFGPIFNYQE